MAVILVIDIGTTTMRAALVDDRLQVVAIEARSMPPATPFPGLVEFDAAAMAGEPRQEALLRPLAGKKLPLIDEVQMPIIREQLPAFLLTRQGYLDRGAVGKDAFNSVVTASLDPIRDQGRAFAAACVVAGVETTFQECAGTIHGFLNLRKALPSAQEDLERAVASLLMLLDRRAVEGLPA